MRRWERITYHERCGGCGLTFERGAPMQIIAIPGMQRVLRRCAGCTSGPTPPNLPELIEPESVELHAAKSGLTKLGGWRPATRGEFKHAAREWLPYPESE